MHLSIMCTINIAITRNVWKSKMAPFKVWFVWELMENDQDRNSDKYNYDYFHPANAKQLEGAKSKIFINHSTVRSTMTLKTWNNIWCGRRLLVCWVFRKDVSLVRCYFSNMLMICCLIDRFDVLSQINSTVLSNCCFFYCICDGEVVIDIWSEICAIKYLHI